MPDPDHGIDGNESDEQPGVSKQADNTTVAVFFHVII